jgi:hypothetical protein
MMESAIDSPAIALFNQPATNSVHRGSLRHFVTRSLRNLRQGNFALLIVFFGCLVIFMRALFGAGYDEGYSAQADAASAKHPSLLARWGSQPQHAIEAQWKKLREKRSESTSAGLWAKIRKEDEGAASSPSAKVPGEDALHWLRVMEDKALSGLGRKPRPDAPLAHEHGAPMHEAARHVQVPVAVPEHPISEDLDEHDVHDEDDSAHSHGNKQVHPPPAPHDDVHNEAPPVAPVAPSDDHDHPRAPSSPDAPADASQSSIADASPPLTSSSSELAEEATPAPSPPPPSHDPEHEDDVDDEPVYMRDEHR